MQKYTNKSDEQLVILVRTHDKELYRYLVLRYEQKLMRYVNYLIADTNSALDVVQETFIKAFVNLNSFNSKKKFSSWIYRIAHNEAMNMVKKYKRETPLYNDSYLFSKQNLEEDFSKKEIIAMAHKCLKSIPFKYSEPLTLFYLEEKSYEEIGEITRLPMGTVAIRISRAKALMKNICQKK